MSGRLTEIEALLGNLSRVLRYLSRSPDRLAQTALRLHELLAVFAIREGSQGALARILAAQDATSPSPYAGIAGVHNLRWYAFEPLEQAGDREATHPTALVFAVIYDGDQDDFLEALLSSARAPLVEILEHTRGFEPTTDPRAFLEARRVRAGYLFRDLGTEDGPYTDPSYLGDASVAEIDDAARVQREFEAFYDEHAAAKTSPSALMKAFQARFSGLRTTLPLTAAERYVPGEARYARKVVELNARLQERIQRRFALERPLRGAHAKGHGLLQGFFEVHESLPARYRRGVFAMEGPLHAWLRPSNGIHQRNPDGQPDARGIAIALDLDPSLEHRWALGFASPSGRAEQDFILFSNPAFFAPDIRAFTTLMSIFQSGKDASKVPRALAYVLGSGSFWTLALFLKTLLFKVSHPLSATFHSATPYRLGGDRDDVGAEVVKYSLEPEDARALERFGSAARGPDCLREALHASLSGGPIVLRFYLHVHRGPRSHRVVDDVEDTTRDWTARGWNPFGPLPFGRTIAERVLAATITIPRIDPDMPDGLATPDRQPDPTSAAALARAEERRFNPWHGLYAHRPLGSLNRARWFIYRDGSKNRREGVPASAALREGTAAARTGTLPTTDPATEAAE